MLRSVTSWSSLTHRSRAWSVGALACILAIAVYLCRTSTRSPNLDPRDGSNAALSVRPSSGPSGSATEQTGDRVDLDRHSGNVANASSGVLRQTGALRSASSSGTESEGSSDSEWGTFPRNDLSVRSLVKKAEASMLFRNVYTNPRDVYIRRCDRLLLTEYLEQASREMVAAGTSYSRISQAEFVRVFERGETTIQENPVAGPPMSQESLEFVARSLGKSVAEIADQAVSVRTETASNGMQLPFCIVDGKVMVASADKMPETASARQAIESCRFEIHEAVCAWFELVGTLTFAEANALLAGLGESH